MSRFICVYAVGRRIIDEEVLEVAKSGKVKALVSKAESAIAKRNYDLAILSYSQALAAEPDNVDVRLALRATQTRNAKENGKKGFKAFIATLKANIHKALKKNDQAILDCEEGLSADPDNIKLLIMLADLAFAAGYLDTAIWQRQSIADSIDPEDITNLYELCEYYREASRAQEAIGCLNRIKAIDSGEDVDGLIREISASLSSQIFERAAKEGSRAILANSEEAEKLELDSGKLRSDEQRRTAIKYRLEHDLVDRPDDYAIWVNIGDIASQMDDFNVGYKEALEYYKKAQELSPANSAIRDKLGDLEMRKTRMQLEALMQKAKSGDETSAAKFKALKEKDLEFQLIEYERRVKEQPMKADFHNRLGQIYLQYKRFDEAIAELQQAAKDPRYKISALTNIGRAMLENKNYKMAISQFERARAGVEIFEKYREPMYWEAVAHQSIGDPESLQRALALFTTLYEVDIKFKDVKDRVEKLQQEVA